MDVGDHHGIVSVLPVLVAVILAFWTRNTILSLGAACLFGVLAAGKGVFAFPELMIDALGNTDFSWILLLELFIGILIAFFQRTGAIQSFSEKIEKRAFTRARVQLTAWVMGMFVFFSDYFSPVFVGSTMRRLSDRARVSREKLAYICDSTSAPVSVIVPITGWAVFIAGLLVGIGPIESSSDALGVFASSIPYNFYAVFSVLLVGLLAAGIVKDFGPMRRAEDRAQNEGKLVRDGGSPLLSKELTNVKPYHTERVLSLGLNFVLPVAIVLAVAISTYIIQDSAKTMEAFLAAVIVLGLLMRIQGIPTSDITETAMAGIKGVMPAVMVLAFAYTINTLSEELGTANYIISRTDSWLTAAMLPLITFVVSCVISFSTGTSWGTFGIVIPIMVPLSMHMSGGETTTLVLATIAAVAGGGVFGDHCSPLSDTTVLASTGAASDHIDHVRTQLPYALTVGATTCFGFLAVGATESLWVGLVTMFGLTLVVLYGISIASGRKPRVAAATDA